MDNCMYFNTDGSPLVIKIKINNCFIPFVVDTGASVSVISIYYCNNVIIH